MANFDAIVKQLEAERDRIDDRIIERQSYVEWPARLQSRSNTDDFFMLELMVQQRGYGPYLDRVPGRK